MASGSVTKKASLNLNKREPNDTEASGYECTFIFEPDDGLKCLLCLAIARDPWQHGKCGRLFCEKCLNKSGADNPCPNCRMEQPLYFEDCKSK